MSTAFDWKRFWCARGETISLSDRGYLADPDSQWGRYLNPALISLDGMREMNCVVLLGEPGIGKSWDLQRHYQELTSKIAETNQETLRVDLRSYADETRLVNVLFESAAFQRWRNGDHILHLFLDSLDECLMRMDNIATLLADELPKQPTDRLRLRIACRTAVWPNILEHALDSLFPEFRAFEMAPLRQ